MDNSENLLHFPCEYPIKVIGKLSLEFEGEVVAIIRRHSPHLSEGAITTKQSQKGNYISLSVLFIAESREQVEAICNELKSLPSVLMLL